MQRSESGALDSFEERIARRRAPSTTSLWASEESSRVAALEEDLRLSAELGQALVAENSELKDRLQAADAARDQLLDRLAASYRDNAALEKKSERFLSSLEATESGNRTLLAALEQDRKTISKLSAEKARGASQETKLKATIRERDDLAQERDILDKRLRASEAKARRATDRLVEQDSRKSVEAMSPSTSPSKRSHLRKSSSTIILRQPSQSELDETNALVESLLQQNQALRSQVSEIRTMLDAAQEETVRLRSDLEQSAFGAAADTSLADEVFSTASLSIPPSPAAAPSSGIMSNERPELRRRGSSSTSDSEAPSIMSYNLPNGSSKPAFGQLAARRRRGLQGPSVQPGGQRPRPQSMQAASKSSRSSQRNLSVDMGNLYNPTRDAKNTLESIADTSPAVSRVQSQILEPTSPTVSRTKPSRGHSPSLEGPTTPTCDASIQTDCAPDDSSSRSPIPMVHSPVPSTSSYQPLHSSTSHQPPSSVTSDSLSEKDRAFMASWPMPSDTPDTTLLSVSSTHSASSQTDSRTAALGSLLEAAAHLLLRVKSANVANLDARLRKQKLPGDVAHLAKSTVKDILVEIEGLREQFRKVVEQERRLNPPSSSSDHSLVTRRDFVQLVKLFREMLNELGRLRSIINRIQLEPSLANKVAELDDLQAYENPISQSATSNTGLLAPISRLLWSQSSGNSTAPAQRSLRRKPSAHPTSKLTALRAVAAETVNVEFGSGAVKQAISAPQSGPPSRDSQFRPSALDGDARSGLRNIFAGSSRQGVLRADREDGWVSLARPTAAPPGRQQKQGAPPTLSSTMDAVLDNFAQSHQQAAQAVPHPKLLERTLRPRGLSDSSIHSTFTSHANPAQVTTTRLSMTEHSLPIADDDLEATLEDSSENAEFMLPPPSSPSQVPIPRSVRPAPRTELGTSTGGGASLFGQWAQWSALDDGTGLATGSRHSHLRSLSRRDKM